MRYPKIDYLMHPAYKSYASEFYGDDSFILLMSNKIDEYHKSYLSLNAPTKYDVQDALSEIKACMNKILHDPQGKDKSILVRDWIELSLNKTFTDFSCEFVRILLSKSKYKEKSLLANEKMQLLQIKNQGMYIADLEANTYASIRNLALKHRAELRQRALLNPSSRSVLNVPFNSSLWNSIKLASKESGILDVLSEFKKNQITLLGAGLEYSCAEQNWHQGLYSDVGLADSSLRYLHVDEGECLPKSMIYITPVNEENGATRAIPQSNLSEKSSFVFNMHKSLDNIVGLRYANSIQKNLYRPIARHPELRRIFMGLPAIFQGTSHFGDDLLNKAEPTNTLEKLEVPYYSQGNNALVFDGAHLFHRGSIVKSGERIAIQVVYRNQNSEYVNTYISGDTVIKDQKALVRKYVRKFIKNYI